MIYLSATLIKDFISCPHKVYLRTTFPDHAEITGDIFAGTIVHNALEKFWKNRDEALNFVTEEILRNESILSGGLGAKIITSINNFFSSPLVDLLSDADLIEHKFRLPFSSLSNKAFIVGKMDRITKDGVIIDWKTSSRTPKTISGDPQMLLYFWAYRKLYAKNPAAILYASLYNDKVVEFTFDLPTYSYFINSIVPSIITAISKNRAEPLGMFNNSCYMCQFKQICKDVLSEYKE